MAGSLKVLSGTFAGRYTIERELGRGATATVYLARDTQRGRAVAIKVLRPELAQSIGANRFLRETRLNTKLHHPHIVAVMDSGEVDGQLYFVLPHMEGGSLRQMLEREKQLSIELAISIARTIADALDYAHKQGLIHRDVKPENILFTSGQACLADFGIARAIERTIDESTTSTGLVRGTPAYMSPEQGSGSTEYDGRSDIYSLALVLYEMLAGVQAFIGATPESVIAQRFQHKPRALRVYRPTVSPAIEAVIDKALSLAAADRYATAAEFASALEAAPRGPIFESRTSGAGFGFNTPKKIATTGAAVFAVFALSVAAYYGRDLISPQVTLEPTRYVVLPVEADSALASATVDELLQRAFRNWRDLDVPNRFRLDEALGSARAVRDERHALSVARSLGAGRYVRSRLTRRGSDLTLTAVVFDSEKQTQLAEASTGLSIASGAAAREVEALVSQLLFRRRDAIELGTRSVAAANAYYEATEARDAFNLRRADSLFLAALEADTSFGRAALWLAQVRMWREEAPASWASWAERAAADGQLAPRDVRLAKALVAVGRRDFASGCGDYKLIARENDRDFASWYGLATCLRADNAVVNDARSPSGYRFRTSYHQAVRAYVRAFELAPALHRSYQTSSFERLRNLLFTGMWQLRSGVAVVPDTTRFLAYAEWRADSLQFIPYPAWMIPQRRVPLDPMALQVAVSNQRNLFRQIASRWASDLPDNPGTKEAVAIALEMVGDPTSLDTLRAARAIATDSAHRLRLAAEEVLMRVSFGRSEPAHLNVAKQLAESLLANMGPPSREQAGTLRTIAVVLGKCRLAGSLAALNSDPQTSARYSVPHFAYAAADSLTVLAALGCGVLEDTTSVTLIERALESADRSRTVQARQQLSHQLLARALRLAEAPDARVLGRYATESRDPILVARRAANAHDNEEVRTFLERLRSRTVFGQADRSPDAVYAESRLWLSVGDTAAARAWLDPVLTRPSWFELMLNRPIDAAALLRSAVLRGQLGSDAGAARWISLVRVLWNDADPDLRPLPPGAATKH